MALGAVEESSGGGKFNIATPDDALRVYKAAVRNRDMYLEHAKLDPEQYRNVAYWTGIVDIYESLFLDKFSEILDSDK